MIESYGFSDAGCVRADNEDRILIARELGMFAVADGMGGHRRGELAADLAIATMKYYLESSQDRHDVSWPFGYDFSLSIDANRLVTGIRLANRQVWKRAEAGPEFAGTGTTLAAAAVHENRTAIANVGDSRVYLCRDGRLEQLTVDDTWIAAVAGRGILSEEEIRRHPLRNVLVQAAGSQNEVDVHTNEVELRDRDLLLLCSDGLHGVVAPEAIGSILAGGGALEALAGRLREAARAEGAPDNVSCVLVGYTGS